MKKKRDLGGIEHEVLAMFMEVENSLKRVLQRLSEMKQYKDSGSVEFGELEILKDMEKTTRKTLENVNGDLSLLMKEYGPETRKHSRGTYTSRDMKFTKVKVEKSRANIKDMEISLDELEEKFRKYNVPKRDVILRSNAAESFDRYLEKLREFMRVTWKEKAEKCRQKEHKSFVEWMVKLEESEDHEKQITFKALRDVFIDIGTKISCFLMDYFLIMSISTDREEMASNLFKVKSMIRCLSVEENSIVINTFLSVVKLFDKTMRMAMKPEQKIDKTKKGDSQIKKENDILHLIIIEVLRLEIGFYHPALPMMVSNEVFLAMGQHLMDNVFKDKLDRLRSKIDVLKILECLSVGSKDSMRMSFEEALDFGIKLIWDKLDLKIQVLNEG